MAKLDSIFEEIMKLDFKSREILFEKFKKRQIDERRDRFLKTANQALKEYRSGKLKAQTAEEVIAELHSL